MREVEKSSPGAVIKIFLTEFHAILALYCEADEKGEGEGVVPNSSIKNIVIGFLHVAALVDPVQAGGGHH